MPHTHGLAMGLEELANFVLQRRDGLIERYVMPACQITACALICQKASGITLFALLEIPVKCIVAMTGTVHDSCGIIALLRLPTTQRTGCPAGFADTPEQNMVMRALQPSSSVHVALDGLSWQPWALVRRQADIKGECAMLQPCQLPSAIYCTLPGTPGGCSAITLNPSGTLLAAACGTSEAWQINVFDMASAARTHVLGPHHGRVGQA